MRNSPCQAPRALCGSGSSSRGSSVTNGPGPCLVWQYRPVDHARAVGKAERDQQPPPDPGGVPRIQPVRVGAADVGEADEAVEPVQDAGVADGTGGRIALPLGAGRPRTIRGQRWMSSPRPLHPRSRGSR